MKEPSQELIETAWKAIAEAQNIHTTREWTQAELFALFEAAVRIGYDRACPERDRVRY